MISIISMENILIYYGIGYKQNFDLSFIVVFVVAVVVITMKATFKIY